MKAILQWILAGFCLLCAVCFDFSFATIAFLAAALVAMPIKAIRKKIQVKTSVICVVAVVLFFVGVFTTPESSLAEYTTEPTVADTTEITTEELTTMETTIEAITTTETSTTEVTTTEVTTTEITTTEPTTKTTTKPTTTAFSSDNLSSGTVSLSSIPKYSGRAYVSLNDNKPYFKASEITTKAFENYSSLDSYGRCGVVIACCGTEIMPADGEERGSISSIKPSGWVQAQYDCVSGKYLYNRCHLIGWQLSAENANRRNLITGTKYLNIEGMLPFENMIADYIHETGNHVMFRVTPMFDGKNLVASGVQMEAYSVEDNGDGICFNVFCYNVQPGVVINYATGSSYLEGGSTQTTTKKPTTTKPATTHSSNSGSSESDYILNTNSKKIHYPGCSAVKRMSDANKREYTGSIDSLYSQGYTTCGICF